MCLRSSFSFTMLQAKKKNIKGNELRDSLFQDVSIEYTQK